MQKIDEGFTELRTTRAPDLWRDIEARTPRPHPGPSPARRLAIVALALAVAGTGSWLAARAFLGTGRPDAREQIPAAESAPATVPRLGPSATFHGAGGGGPLYAFGSVWIPLHHVTGKSDGVLRIDPETLEVEASIAVESVPGWEVGDSGFAAGADGVWVAGGTGLRASVVKIDPATNEVVAGLPLEGEFAGDVEVSEGTVWVSIFGRSGEMSVAAIRDTRVPDVVMPIEVEGGWIREVFAVGDRIVAHTRGAGGEGSPNRLTVIDARTLEVISTRSLEEAIFTEWNGSIWAGATDAILRIDPRTAEVVERHPLGMYVTHSSIAGGEGGLWFFAYEANEGADVAKELVRFNPSTGEIDASIDVGRDPVALTVGDDAIWVFKYDGTLTRVDLVPA